MAESCFTLGWWGVAVIGRGTGGIPACDNHSNDCSVNLTAGRTTTALARIEIAHRAIDARAFMQ